MGPPIAFLYLHFHNAIRSELEVLASSITRIESASEEEVTGELVQLRHRYRFLKQVYSYHSSVEDEVRAGAGVLDG